MKRREFLKACGRAGLLAGAGGVFSASFLEHAEAAGDVPKVVRLHGSPKEMGRQYARQIGELIVERLRRMEQKGSRVSAKAVQQSRMFLMVSAMDILTEIESLAEALGEESEKLLILAAEPPGVGIRPRGCSSFVVKPKAMKDGKTWVGENVDDDGTLAKYGIVIVRHPASASPPMVTWALAGGVGGIGMNRAGVALTMNYVEAGARKPLAAIFHEFVANAALRQKTFDNAKAVLAKTQVMDPVIYTLVGPDGTCDVIERTPHVFQFRARDEKVTVCTNHFLSDKLKITAPDKPVFADSPARLKRLTRLLGKDDLTEARLRAVLADTDGAPRSICREAEPSTIASILMNVTDRTFWSTRGRPNRAKYGKVHLYARPERD